FFVSHGRDEGEMILIRAFNCIQGQRYLELAEKRQPNESFVYGWIKERLRL
uniref:putative peptidoglycan-binding domain-containing protein n=1 Tax=Salmonella enterica TaxID=28901 RepID=UPI0032989CC1